jgi:pimeloyl-ACP methyl ester carboxylesterase
MLRARGLEYEDQGSGEPVLLIHGSWIAGAFVPLMSEPALASQYRLIRYHRRGFAGSDPVTGVPHLGELEEDAAGLLEHLGVERVHVVGHSAGGGVAARLAIDRPELVHSLALLEPALMTQDEAAAFADAIAPIIDLCRRGEGDTAADLFMGPDWRADVHRTIPGGEAQVLADVATFADWDAPATIGQTWSAEDRGRIECPVLHIRGDESIYDTTHLVRMLAPDCEEALISGVGHGLQIVKPQPVARVIADFLARNPVC